MFTDLAWQFYRSLSCHLWVFRAHLGYALEDEHEIFRTLAQYQRLACYLGAVLLVVDDDEAQLVLVPVAGVKEAKERGYGTAERTVLPSFTWHDSVTAQLSTELTTTPRNSRVGVEGVVLDDD